MSESVASPLGCARRALGVAALLAWALVVVTHGATYVRGGSMEPALVRGDIVVYRRGDAGLDAGDVVLFDHAGQPGGVVHRVVGVLPDGSITTAGDANTAVDRDPVERSQVRGVAVAVLPTGRAGRAIAGALR